MTGGHEGSTQTPTKSKESLAWLTEPQKLHPRQRDSSASMVSAESYDPSEIGKAVEMAVVEEQRGVEGPVRHTYVEQETPKFEIPAEMADFDPGLEGTFEKRGRAEDEESVFSSSTVHIGRLDTVRSYDNSRNPPELTVSTNVDSVIPPRSKRRPVSEIITGRTSSASTSPTKRGHRHRYSLTISDDLDKLMETASILTESSRAGSVSRHNTNTSRQSTASASRDSFQTADDLSMSGKSASEQPLVIPKRPNARDLDRARQASASHGNFSKNRDSWDHSDAKSATSDQVSTTTWKEEPGEETHIDASDNVPKSPPLSPSVKLKRTHVSTRVDPSLGSAVFSNMDRRVKAAAESVAREPSQASSHYPSEDLARSEVASRSAYAPRSLSSTQSWTKSNASISSKHRSGDLRVVNMDQLSAGLPIDEEGQLDEELVDQPQHSIQPDRGLNLSDIQQSLEKGHSQFPDKTVESQQADRHKDNGRGQDQKVKASAPTDTARVKQDTNLGYSNPEILSEDDGFYDIEEPVVISHPPRAKSVRDRTRGPHHKGSKRKSRRSTHRDSAASGGHLKPFSYNTLVNLLESMNGTVIGEEFETLNLPIQEKQIIEKIIDSLSRLTSDMVLDKNRFDIGMERLEKAHRVLEGFL